MENEWWLIDWTKVAKTGLLQSIGGLFNGCNNQPHHHYNVNMDGSCLKNDQSYWRFPITFFLIRPVWENLMTACQSNACLNCCQTPPCRCRCLWNDSDWDIFTCETEKITWLIIDFWSVTFVLFLSLCCHRQSALAHSQILIFIVWAPSQSWVDLKKSLIETVLERSKHTAV